MSYSGFAANLVVQADGIGNIFTTKGDGSNRVEFPYDGYHPSFAWNGNAIIFVDVNTTGAWCSNIDGSGLYNLGVIGQTHLVRPQLSFNNSKYCMSSINPAGGWDVYVFGGGGYGLRRVITSAASPGCITPDGAYVYASGWTGPNPIGAPPNTYRLMWNEALLAGPEFANSGWIPYDPPHQDFPHAGIPSISPDGNMLAFMVGDFTGLNLSDPATYRASAIAVSPWSGGAPAVLAIEHGPKLVTNPSWWKQSDGLIYDFVTPDGCGTWALSLPWLASNSAPVFGNPHGGTFQINSVGCNRVQWVKAEA